MNIYKKDKSIMGISNRMGCLLVALALGYSAQAGIAFAIKMKKDTTTQTAKIDTTKVQKPNGKEVKVQWPQWPPAPPRTVAKTVFS